MPVDHLGWHFSDHVCRQCLGTIMQRGAEFVCSICRAESVGSPKPICGCGLRAKTLTERGGFRCARNPTPTPANPSHNIILFGDDPASIGAAN